MLHELPVDKNCAGMRLDAFVAHSLSDISRSYALTLISNGNVLVNDKIAKPSYKVCENTVVSVIIPEPEMTDMRPENIPLDIVYEDKDLLVINKPQGMVVHPAVGVWLVKDVCGWV